MTVVHTQYGPGEIVASDTVRGRMQYKVAGPGFEIWVDETKVPPQHLGWAPVDHDNSVDLPYNPDPQYPAIPGDVESTIQPIHEIDAEERLSPADSITFEHRRRDEGDNRGRPGPNPDLFAKGASYHYADYEDEGEFGGHPSDTDIPGGPPQGPSPGGGDDPLMLTLPEFLDEVTQVLQQHPEWAHRSLGDLMEDPEVLQSVASEQGPLEMGPPPPEQGPPESPSDEGESGSESEPSDEGESEDSGESSDEDSGESDEDSGENPFDKGEESDESDEDSDESEAKDESENSDESDDECTCDHDDDDDDDDGNPFAKESGYFRDDNWQTGQSEEPAFDPHESEYGSGGPSGFSDLHPAVQQQILDHFGIGAPMSESEVFENSGYNKHAPGYNPHRDYTRWESSVHEAIAPAVMAILPQVLRTVGPSVARGVGSAAFGGGGDDQDQSKDPYWGQQSQKALDEAKNQITPTVDKPLPGLGSGWGDLAQLKNAGYRPAGLDDHYIDLQAAADHFYDPVTAFRDDPVGYINRIGHVEDEGLNPRFAEYIAQVDSDRQIREAAWKDVRNKALRLRRDGQVHVKDMAPDRIYATVQGDHGVYDVMIAKGASFGGLGGGHAISNWRCACEWGKWAFRRRYTYVGRLCSHGYATYLEMQSQHTKGKTRMPRQTRPPKRRKRSDIVQSTGGPAAPTPETTAPVTGTSLTPGPAGPPAGGAGGNAALTPGPAGPTPGALGGPPGAQAERQGRRRKRADAVGEQAPDAAAVLINDPTMPTLPPTTARRRQADALQMVPQRLTPELVINDAEDQHLLMDVTKDERKTTGPGQIVHFSRLMEHCDRTGTPYPRELVGFLLHYADHDPAHVDPAVPPEEEVDATDTGVDDTGVDDTGVTDIAGAETDATVDTADTSTATNTETAGDTRTDEEKLEDEKRDNANQEGAVGPMDAAMAGGGLGGLAGGMGGMGDIGGMMGDLAGSAIPMIGDVAGQVMPMVGDLIGGLGSILGSRQEIFGHRLASEFPDSRPDHEPFAGSGPQPPLVIHPSSEAMAGIDYVDVTDLGNYDQTDWRGGAAGHERDAARYYEAEDLGGGATDQAGQNAGGLGGISGGGANLPTTGFPADMTGGMRTDNSPGGANPGLTSITGQRHYADDQTTQDWKVRGTGEARKDLEWLRDEAEEGQEEHFGDMEEHVDEVQKHVQDARDAGVDASPLVASIKRAGKAPKRPPAVPELVRIRDGNGVRTVASAPPIDDDDPYSKTAANFADEGGETDVVAAFQRSAAATELITGGGEDFDIAAAARAHLKTAGRNFSLAEQHELMHERHPLGARNLDSLDLAGTHYEAENSVGLW